MTPVLLRHLLTTAAVLISVAAVAVYFLLGTEVVIGLLVGAVLALADGAGLVYLVGQLLQSDATRSKGTLFFILFGKLFFVAGLLWAAMSVFGVSGLGIILGIGVALLSLVIGVNRGSSSPEGQRAMAEEEARIAQELGDNDPESS